MPCIELLLERNDLPILINWLKEQEDIASIIYSGDQKYKAIKEIKPYYNNRYCLWHFVNDKLPLITTNQPVKEQKFIDNPWDGWTAYDLRSSIKQLPITLPEDKENTPYFGAGHPGIFLFKINMDHTQDSFSISRFEWIGNHYSASGNKSTPEAKQWWEKLKRMIKNNSEFKDGSYLFPDFIDKWR
jgi:hypothetical protein